ncbi:MAG: amino acid-binding protein [Bacteroidaceae bacterium]|nr:amino acid-binding protein [Bacteroidaceae bacterium]
MTIRQLSVFLENTSGTLIQVLSLLGEARVQLIATTIADTAEYGILRIICAEPQRACEALKQAGIAVAMSDVFALQLDNKPGAASDAIRQFSQAGISITYIYTFLYRDKGILIFRTDNPELARETIAKAALPVISEEDLTAWK